MGIFKKKYLCINSFKDIFQTSPLDGGDGSQYIVSIPLRIYFKPIREDK